MNVIQNRYLIFVLFLFATVYCGAISNKCPSSISLQWDNDVLFMTDKDYTQGVFLNIKHPSLAPKKAIRLLTLVDQSESAFVNGSISLRNMMFTPKNIRSPEIQYADRPYAGLTWLEYKTASFNPKHCFAISGSINVGVLGPLSGTGKFQTAIHKTTNNPLPQGWNHQIGNALMLDYEWLFAFTLRQITDYINLNAGGTVHIGTIFNYLSPFVRLSAGNKTKFSAANIAGVYNNSPGKYTINCFAEISPKLNLYDATLSGSPFMDNSSYEIPWRKTNKIVTSVKSGIEIQLSAFGLQFFVQKNTSGFDSSKGHTFSGIVLSYTSFSSL